MGAANPYPQTPAAAPGESVSNLWRADQALALTPQEQNLYQHHLNNLWVGGRVDQPGGEVSTLLQAVVEGPGDRYYNIPTVWNGKVLSIPRARNEAAKVGWQHWPSYPSEEEADTRYMKMHDYMATDAEAYFRQHPELRVKQSLADQQVLQQTPFNRGQ